MSELNVERGRGGEQTRQIQRRERARQDEHEWRERHRATADTVLIKECIPHQQHSPNVYHINCTPSQQMKHDLAAANPPLPYAHILQVARPSRFANVRQR